MEKEKIEEIINKSSSINRTLGITFALFLFYISINVASTTDLLLFLPESKITLPLLNLDLPIKAFYLAAPFLLLIFHYNLLVHLNMHCKKLNQWYKNGKKKGDENIALDPFMLNFIPTNSNSTLRIGIRFVIRLTIFILPLSLLIYIQLRFSDYQSWGFTLWHFFCVLFDFFLIITHSNEIIKQLRFKKKENPNKFKDSLKRFKYESILLSIPIINFFLFVILMTVNINETFLAGVTEWFPKISLENQTLVSSIPEQQLIQLYTEGKHEEMENLKLKFTKGYNLDHRNFRLARLSWTILTNSSFEYADLQGASFFDAHLEGVNFKSSNLRSSYLTSSQLQKADLSFANLKYASVYGENFQEVKFKGTSFSPGMDFSNTNLKGAHFSGSTFLGDTMDLRASKFDESNMEGVIFNEAIMHGSLFSKTNLKGTNFSNVLLFGSYFKQTDMNGASFGYCQLQGTTFDSITMNGAIINSSNLKGVDFKNISKSSYILLKNNHKCKDDFDINYDYVTSEFTSHFRSYEYEYYATNYFKSLQKAKKNYTKDSLKKSNTNNNFFINKIDSTFLISRRNIAHKDSLIAANMLRVRDYNINTDTIYNDLLSYLNKPNH